MEKAEAWYTVECECPYCGEVQQADSEPGDVMACGSCGTEFEIGEPVL